VFKNPGGPTSDLSAGRLIDEAGLKGRRVGGAEVSPVHANFIVNAGGANSADVLSLIEAVRAEVLSRHGVSLDLEVKVWE
jgi:UDP-N-acetylmuramate dehydrogenase